MESPQLQPARRLACRRCYRHKLRCVREPGAAKCARCNKMNVICEDRLEKNMGRPRAARPETVEASQVGSSMRPYDLDPYNIGEEQTESSADDTFVEMTQRASQTAPWSGNLEDYHSAGTQTFGHDYSGTPSFVPDFEGIDSGAANPTQSAPTPSQLNSYESCVDVLSDLHKFLFRQQAEAYRTDPLSGFDISNYPFTNMLTPDILHSWVSRMRSQQQISSEQSSQSLGLQNTAKRVYAAAHLFLELVQGLDGLISRNRSQQIPGTGSRSRAPSSSRLGGSVGGMIAPVSPPGLETPLMAIGCYLRILGLFNSILDRMIIQQQRNLQANVPQPSAMGIMAGTGMPSSQYSVPQAGVSTNSQIAGPVVDLTAYLVGVIDEGMREYLSNIASESTLTMDTVTTSMAQQRLQPFNDDLTSAVERVLKPSLAEVAALRDKLRRSLHHCESLQISPM